MKVRDGPPQPNAKDGGYRQVAFKKVDVGAYGTDQKMNKPNKAAIQTEVTDSDFGSIVVRLTLRFGRYDKTDLQQKELAAQAQRQAAQKKNLMKSGKIQ